MSDMLEADSIRKQFGTNQILTDIALKCQSGDIIGLLGRNGSGKSTLLKILFGTLHTDFKFIRINGEVLAQPFRYNKKISFLNQNNFLPKNLTVKQVFDFYSANLDTGFLDDVILDKVAGIKIKNLSGGESRYLEVKLILYLDSGFILLDEPFNGISPVHVGSIKELITDKSRKKGIILTDHDYRNVLDVANRLYLLFDGGLKIIRSKQDLIDWSYIPDN